MNEDRRHPGGGLCNAAPISSVAAMGWITSFFSSNDGLHQVMRTGSLITDLSTGKSGFVVSDGPDFSMVTDQGGGLHQIIKNGSMSTDLTTGATYFKI